MLDIVIISVILFLFTLLCVFLIHLTSRLVEKRVEYKENRENERLFNSIKVGNIYRLKVRDSKNPFCDDPYIYCKILNKKDGFVLYSYCDRNGENVCRVSDSSDSLKFKEWELWKVKS